MFRSWKQQHEESCRSMEKSIDRITKSLEAQQRPRTPAPGVVSQSSATLMAADEPPLLTASPRGVRVEWPCSFDGNEALQWLDKIEQFFSFYELTDPYRLKIAATYFDGPVVPWFQELQKSETPLTWSVLAKAIESSFVPSDFDGPCAETQVIVDTWPIPKTAGDALELFEEMPKRGQGIEEMLEEMEFSDELESDRFHQTIQVGLEESDINVISLPDSLPQEGEMQGNLEIAQLMTENAHLKSIIDDLKKRTLDAEFATVRHLIKVLEDRIADMARPVNLVAFPTVSADGGWLLSSDSALCHCIQTLELRRSSEPRAAMFFNQFVVLLHSRLLLLANAKKNAIYAVHSDYGPVDVFDVFQQLNPGVAAALLERRDRYTRMEVSEELIETSGRLHLLVITYEKGRATGLKIEHLEETFVASTTSYLDHVVVYVGSSYGGSQLIELNMRPDAKGSYVKILERHVTLGPIVDFCVVDLNRQGQDQVVPCSGAYKNGSLHVVRNDVGINEHASVELQVITGFWSLRRSITNPYDTFWVVSFIYDVIGASGEITIGPFAVVSLLISSMIQLVVGSSLHQIPYKKLIFITTFFVGIFHASVGLFRLGFVVEFLSHVANVGLMTGIAIVIGLQPLKGLLQIDHFTYETTVVSVDKAVWTAVPQPLHMGNFIIGRTVVCTLNEDGPFQVRDSKIPEDSIDDQQIFDERSLIDTEHQNVSSGDELGLGVHSESNKLSARTSACTLLLSSDAALFHHPSKALTGIKTDLYARELIGYCERLVSESVYGFETAPVVWALLGPARPPPAPDEVQSLVFANRPLFHSVPLVLSGVLAGVGWPWLLAWKLPPAPNLSTLQCQFTIQDLEGKVLI